MGVGSRTATSVASRGVASAASCTQTSSHCQTRPGNPAPNSDLYILKLVSGYGFESPKFLAKRGRLVFTHFSLLFLVCVQLGGPLFKDRMPVEYVRIPISPTQMRLDTAT